MEPNEGEKQVQGNTAAESSAPRNPPPKRDFVEVPLSNTGEPVPKKEEEGSAELSRDTADAPTIPVRRRRSIELQRVESNPQPEVADGKDIPPKPERQSYPKPEVIYAPERLSNLMGCFKLALIIITSVLVIFGAAITVIASVLKADPDFWNIRNGLDLKQFSSAANIGIVVGVVILIIGVIGLCGAIRESACMLIGYFIIALLLVILECVAVGLVWSATNDQEGREKLSKLLWEGVEALEKHDVQTNSIIDIVQEKLHCCGVTGDADYEGKGLEPPRSCFDPETRVLYSEGCLDKLLNYLKDKAALIGGVTVAILLLQIGGLGLALLLCCAIRQGSSKVF